jgi:ABC-type uncharacterized transport system permease subunit
MTGTKLAFMILSAALALLGLFAAGAAREVGMSIFGWGLFLFGIGFALFLIKRHFDEAETRAHGAPGE